MNTTIERPAPQLTPPRLQSTPVIETKTAIAFGVVTVLFLAFAGWITLSDWVPAPSEEPARPAVFEISAPAGDFFTPVDAVGRSGAREQASLLERLGPIGDDGLTVIESSIRHEANAVSTADGSIALYRWQSTDTNGAVTDCFGEFLDSGRASSTTCGPNESGQPNMSWGHGTNEATTKNSVSVWNAPAEARWMIATSTTGQITVSPVANQVTYGEWFGTNNDPTQVQLLDGNFEQVWAQAPADF